MLYHVELQTSGTLTGDQLELLAGDGPIIIHQNTAHRLVNITLEIETAAGIAAAAAAAWESLTSLWGFIDNGAVAEPHRFLIETEEAHQRNASLIGARETARRLNLSEARVAKLHDHPQWPTPVYTLPSGEQIHTPDAIDAFAKIPRPGGRPRRTT